MPSMSSLLRGAVNNRDDEGQGVQRKPVNCVHDNDASVLAVGSCEVLQQGQFHAAVMVVRKVWEHLHAKWARTTTGEDAANSS